MTGLLMMILGLASTGLMYPNYEGITQTVNTNEQIIQQIEDEALRNFIAEQEEIIVEDYFLFLDKIGKIKYARGCMGEYTPPTRSEEKQKRVKCSNNAYDCAGLVKAYGIAKGIITSSEAKYYNSQSLMELAQQKHATLAQRGDRTSWQGYGERSEGPLSTHFAMVSRDYTGGNILWVYDNVNGPNNNRLGERALRVVRVGNKFHYLGKYRITVYTNGFVEKAKQDGITVERRYDTDPQEEPEQIDNIEMYDPTNPHGYSTIISGFAYDSDANKIASYWTDHGGTDYMIGKFKGEGAFNIYAIGKKGERGICQLLYNKTNKIWIDDPRWNTREFQAQVCLDKRNAVPNPDTIRLANSYIQQKYISHP